MKTLKQILELYKPKSQDEDKFVKKHIVVKHRDKNGNGDDVFQATNIKAVGRKKERHGYEPGQDEEVYEETETLDEMDHDRGSIINRHITKTKDDPKREAGRNLALKKKWGDKNYGLPEPKVKTVAREETETLDEVDTNAAKQLHARLKQQHNDAVDRYDDQSDKMSPQQKKAEQQKIDRLHDRVQRAKSYIRKEETEHLEEKLKVSDGIGTWISDFIHSKNPKFDGFSKRKRMKMAQAAFYSAQRGD